MSKQTIPALKIAAESAVAAYDAEKARLTELGMKSKDRYEALKGLKTAADAAWSAYNGAATTKAVRGLRAIAQEVSAEKRAAKALRNIERIASVRALNAQ